MASWHCFESDINPHSSSPVFASRGCCLHKYIYSTTKHSSLWADTYVELSKLWTFVPKTPLAQIIFITTERNSSGTSCLTPKLSLHNLECSKAIWAILTSDSLKRINPATFKCTIFKRLCDATWRFDLAKGNVFVIAIQHQCNALDYPISLLR